MPTISSLVVALSVHTRPFVQGMARAGTAVAGFSKQIKAQRAGMIAAGGLFSPQLLGIGGIALLVAENERFQRAMNRSMAIMGDLSDEMRARLAKTAIDVARVTKFSARDAAESYFFLASAGLTAEQSLRALPVVATFAQAGMFDMARATDLLTDAQSALGLTVADSVQNMENLKHVADVLVKANTLANASTEQFSQALTTKAGTAIKILNKDIEEGVAVLAAFADQGIKAQEAGTALNIVLRDLTTKAIKNAAAFERHGVRVFDAAGQMRNIADIIADLEAAFEGQSDATRKALLQQLGFADKSIVFTQALIGTSDKIRRYEEALRAAAGTSENVAGKQLTDLEKAVSRLGAAWTDLATSSTTGLIPALVNALAIVIEHINKWRILRKVFDSILVVWQALKVGMASVVAGLATTILQIAKAINKFADFIFLAKHPISDEAITSLEQFAAGAWQGAGEELDELKKKWDDLGAMAMDDAADGVEANAKRITDALGAVGEGFDDVANRSVDAEAQIDGLIKKLERQIATFDMSATQAELYDIGLENVSDAQLESIRTLERELDALEANRKAMQRAEEVIRSIQTPTEVYEQTIDELQKLLDDDLINLEQFARAAEAARKQLERATDTRDAGHFKQISLRQLALTGAAGTTKSMPEPSKEKTQEQIRDELKAIKKLLEQPQQLVWEE